MFLFHCSEDKSSIGRGVLGAMKAYMPTPEELRILRLVVDNEVPICEVFKFYRYENNLGILYSKQYKRAKTGNSYTIKFMENDGVFYGKIKYFLGVGTFLFASTELYEKLNEEIIDFTGIDEDSRLLQYKNKLLCPQMAVVKTKTAGITIVPVEHILSKCVFIDLCKGKSLISCPPNLKEHS